MVCSRIGMLSSKMSLLLRLVFASVVFVSSTATADSGDCGNNRELTYPKIVDVDEEPHTTTNNNTRGVTLDLEWLEINPGFGDSDGYDAEASGCSGTIPFFTRALGGSVPGPTIKVSPGTTLRVRFRNRLTYQPESRSSRVVLAVAEEGQTSSYRFTGELDPTRLNKFNDPDVGNLHFHGCHVPGELPSDDTSLEVFPGEEYEYFVEFPKDHEPGLHWIHPHHHGSSTLHLAGGAALAIIVKDPRDDVDDGGDDEDRPAVLLLPTEVRDATERVMVFQDWNVPETLQAARHAGDLLLGQNFSRIEGGDSIGQRFVTVNGKYQPVASIPVGKWERWRFLYAGWQDLPLNFGVSDEGEDSDNDNDSGADCEFYLLAKDGIYLSDYPRGPMIYPGSSKIPIPAGGRADFMVRCNAVGGTTRFEALGRRNVLVLNCVEAEDGGGDENQNAAVNNTAPAVPRSPDPPTRWIRSNDDRPDYLQPVDGDVLPTPGCSCGTEFDGYDDTSRVNEQIYRPGNRFMHTTYLGAVVERKLMGMHTHSYHQHVYPYQLIDFPSEGNGNDNDNSGEYFKVGDWHDTYLDKKQKGGPVTIRYRTTDVPGKIMVHCHNSLHSDTGMIQKEYVRNVTDGSNSDGGFCLCDYFEAIGGPGIVGDVGGATSDSSSSASNRPGGDGSARNSGSFGIVAFVLIWSFW
mmetsp:Transcript_8444/g.20198  ORF Transcript_8444/g.20198 Transcript_8444/m.20198 type:complete len:687 (-) Transcript_8444:219-2279(-)